MESANTACDNPSGRADEPAHKLCYEIDSRKAGEPGSQSERVAPGIVAGIDERLDPRYLLSRDTEITQQICVTAARIGRGEISSKQGFAELARLEAEKMEIFGAVLEVLEYR